MSFLMAAFVSMLLLMWCSMYAAELRGAVINREKEEMKNMAMKEEAPDTLAITMNNVKQLDVKDVKVAKRQLDDASSTQSIDVETLTTMNWGYNNYDDGYYYDDQYDDGYYYDDQYDDGYYYDDEQYDDGYYYDDQYDDGYYNDDDYYYDDANYEDGYYYDDYQYDDGYYYDDTP